MSFELKKWNNMLGWVVFLIASFTYLSTIEPELSFWDCGEYISSASKLEVTHSPGAAFFQLFGAVFSIFAFGDSTKYARVINSMNALFSALTILFLFWTITHLALKLMVKNINDELSIGEKITVLGSGFVGALVFCFSDTFWFSAVEGEVYAMASMFTALLLWLICKWENEADEPRANRWLILISLVIGLSVGVHLMAILVVPALCYIYYTRKYTFAIKSFVIANIVTIIVLALVFKIIFPLTMTFFGKLEIFFVNGMGLPFHSGTFIAFILLGLLFYSTLKYLEKNEYNLAHTATLCVLFILIGFSSWLMIPIRANANPPMNLNDPDTAIGMLDYYNREQYGDWPVFYGPDYTAYIASDGILNTIQKGAVYEKDETVGRYVETSKKIEYEFNPKYISVFPRMYNQDPAVINNYVMMSDVPTIHLTEDAKTDPKAAKAVNDFKSLYNQGKIGKLEYMDYIKHFKDILEIDKPTLGQNIKFFLDYQIGYMYIRYLMWNFAGRQNDLEGNYEVTKGNWISGIKFIDEMRLGTQNSNDLPRNQSLNKAHNTYFFLPLILGLIGFFFQFNKDFGRSFALISAFLLTGVGIILYTSMKPFEPRERDYALVSSFYIFAIWVGLGVLAILKLIKQTENKTLASIVVAACLGVPTLMAFQNWDDHDRSGRTTAHDFAYSYLNHLDKDAILFVYGDNDTYPLWALQETSGFRNDVKVSNMTLLSTAWNIDQNKRKTYNSKPLPLQLKHTDYRDGINDAVKIVTKDELGQIIDAIKKEPELQAYTPHIAMLEYYLTNDSMSVKEAINFIQKDSQPKQAFKEIISALMGYDGGDLNILPVSKLYLPVDKQKVLKNGIVKAMDADKIVPQLTWSLSGSSLNKNHMVLLDVLANFNWDRSIYFSAGGLYDPANLLFLNDYLQYEGFVFKLVPIYTKSEKTKDDGYDNPMVLYNTVKSYKWGGLSNAKTYFDPTCRNNILSYRSAVGRTAEKLALVGEKAKALEVLNLCMTKIPQKLQENSVALNGIARSYILAGNEKKGLEISKIYQDDKLHLIDYYSKLSIGQQSTVGQDMQYAPLEYAGAIDAVSSTYAEMGDTIKAANYIKQAMIPLDKKFNKFLTKLRLMNRSQREYEFHTETMYGESYKNVLGILSKYDEAYAKDKEEAIFNPLLELEK